jgi:predicted transcriptional regulator
MSKHHPNKTGRSGKLARYLALPHWMMGSAAWRSLLPVERAIQIELMSRWVGPGSNNGSIPFSVREAAEAVNVSKDTAARALQILVEKGFLSRTSRGAFSRKGRHATEWLVTLWDDDRTNRQATKDFARWEPSDLSKVRSEVKDSQSQHKDSNRDDEAPLASTVPQTRPDGAELVVQHSDYGDTSKYTMMKGRTLDTPSGVAGHPVK